MTSFDTGKERRFSGLRARRLKFKGASAEQIVVFDPSERGSELGRGRVKLWKVYDRHSDGSIVTFENDSNHSPLKCGLARFKSTSIG